ncbi:hypothetical protein BGX26_007200 [Mortierella sp. AD094]|nr:hypothetical protein BGX26_007200 [Mortierella sp. AD094]
MGYSHSRDKQRHKAKELRYDHLINQQTGSSRPGNKNGAPHQHLCPVDAFSVTPIAANAMGQDTPHPSISRPIEPNPLQDGPSTNVENVVPTESASQDTPRPSITPLTEPSSTQDVLSTNVEDVSPAESEGPIQSLQMIFAQSVILPVTEYALPEPCRHFASTPQLAYCLSLIQYSMVSDDGPNEIECKLPQYIPDDKDEQERLKAMPSDLIRAFIRDDLKKRNVVTEIVSLSAVLEQDDFVILLHAFVTCIDQSTLLKIHLLDGLSQLIRNASQEYIDSDDLVTILRLLHQRLMNTHKQSTGHTYRLALTISNVLDSMVDCQVDGISSEQLSMPLRDYLDELQKSSNAYLVYQAAYASQALMHINDDGSVLKTAQQRTGKVTQGISGVVSAVKALDLIGVIDGLNNTQQGLTGAENLAKLACRLADFEELVRKTPCKKDPAFQWGLCQRLGEIAANDVWHDKTRKCAIDFLGELYKDDTTWGPHADIKQWIVCILSQLVSSAKDVTSFHSQMLLKELETDGSTEKQELYQLCRNDSAVPYPMVFYQLPKESLLLDRVQNKPDIRYPLLQLKSKRLKDKNSDVYISPKAKSSIRAKVDFDLMFKVQEFLQSKKSVFLLLGDSGAGKSTFNRALEVNLWEKYGKEENRIPLYIYLPLIEKPENNLITKQLQRLNFTEIQIKELKEHHKFILICDGYDESQ